MAFSISGGGDDDASSLHSNYDDVSYCIHIKVASSVLQEQILRKESLFDDEVSS